MGTVVTICEIVLQVGFIAQGVTEIVLRAQIEALIKGHEHEFQLMVELDGFMDMVLEQTNLVNQINTSSIFAANNWNNIFSDLRKKEQLANKILASIPNVKSSNYAFTLRDGLVIVASTAILGFCSYNLASGLKKNYSSKSSTMSYDDYAKTTSTKIKSSAPEIKSVKYTPEAGHSVEILNHGSNSELAPPSSKDSKVRELKAQESKGNKTTSKALMGLRIVAVGVSVWAFYKGLKNLKALSDQLDYYRQYFSENGDFEKAKEGMIEDMNYVAGDIFTLGCASRAAYFDCQNSLLVVSICSAQHQETVMSYLKQLNCSEVGLTDEFIDASAELAQQAGKISNSGQKSEIRLEKLEKLFDEFYTQKKPEIVFLTVATTLSQVIGKCSLITGGIATDQKYVNQFLDAVDFNFQMYRKLDFQELTSQEKQKVDANILKMSLIDYQDIFKLGKIPLQDVVSKKEYQDIRNVLFSAIISFTELYYYDDMTGATLFGKQIKYYKDNLDYSQLLLTEQLVSQANVIPVCMTNMIDEQKEREIWLAKAQQENKKLNLWPVDRTPKVLFRYIRVEVGSFKSSFDGNTYDRLLSYEGMRMDLDLQLYSIEESVNDRDNVVLKNLTKMEDMNTNKN